MTKSDTVRLLHSERCSVSEIAAAVDWKPAVVQDFLRDKLIRASVNRAFIGWRGFPVGTRVVSL